jgi:hypothetical protein
MRHDERCSVGADGEEPGMAERDLARISHEYIQAHGEDNVDENDVEEIDSIARKIEGKGEQKYEKGYRPYEDGTAAEQLDVLVVIALHVHRITSCPLNEMSWERFLRWMHAVLVYPEKGW